MMTDDEYAALKTKVTEAKRTISEHEDELLIEALRRDDAYVLYAWYLHYLTEFPYLTLEEAVNRAEDDCVPVKIVGPGGIVYDQNGKPDVAEGETK